MTKDKIHEIPMTWKTTYSIRKVELPVTLSSRSIKALDESPGDVLFRTHNYELYAELTDNFLKQVGINTGFIAELKLFKQDYNDKWLEFKANGTPAVTCSFTEDMQNQGLRITIQWAQSTQTSWRNSFRFHFNIFGRTQDGEHYTRLISKQSSEFLIHSKPQVYIQQVNKRNATRDLSDKRAKKRRKSEPDPVSPKDMLKRILDNIEKQDDEESEESDQDDEGQSHYQPRYVTPPPSLDTPTKKTLHTLSSIFQVEEDDPEVEPTEPDTPHEVVTPVKPSPLRLTPQNIFLVSNARRTLQMD